MNRISPVLMAIGVLPPAASSFVRARAAVVAARPCDLDFRQGEATAALKMAAQLLVGKVTITLRQAIAE